MLKFGNGSGGGSDERRNQERDREPGIRLLPEGNSEKFPAGLFDSGNGGDSHPFGKEPGAFWGGEIKLIAGREIPFRSRMLRWFNGCRKSCKIRRAICS